MERPLDYLLRGRIKYVASRRLYIDSSRVHGRGLRSSALPSLTLAFILVTQFTLFLFGAQSLAVYVDDILLTGSDSAGLLETKEYLKCHFVTKDMDRPKYLLGLKLHIKTSCTSFSMKVCSGSSGRNKIF